MHLRIYLRLRSGQLAGSLYFIVNDNWFGTGIKCHQDHWDPDQGIIKKSHPKYYQVNPLFGLYKSRAEMCVANLRLENTIFNKRYFELFVFKSQEDADNPLFAEIIDDYIKKTKLGWGREKHYNLLKKNVQEVMINPRLQDINYNFALLFQQHLRTKDNNENTVSSKTAQLKAVVHHALKIGFLKSDPLINIKRKAIVGMKEHLTAAELQALEDLYKKQTLKPVEQAILKYFLFSCYTGLRYSDIAQLKYYNIKDDCVCTVQEKTEKPVMVPLIKKAKDLLQVTSTGVCFKVHSNQVTNKNLKTIMKAAEINKSISYHCSRHTFGTLSIYWGIPKEVVAELMGVDFKTVEVYAKIIDDVKKREMLKWEQAV